MMSKEKVKEWRKNNKDKMIKCMGGCCQICGYNKCNASLEFHHLDPSKKDIGLANIRANPKSWDNVVVPELKKCILLCANCHREVHNNYVDLPTNFYQFNDDFLKEQKLIITNKRKCVCGNQKDPSANYCTLCYNNNKRKFTDEDLLELKKQNLSNIKISKILNVSETSIRKRLKLINLNTTN
jgi:hypothetical protein